MGGFFVGDMKVIQLKELSGKNYKRIMQRSSENNEAIIPVVKSVLNDVQKDWEKNIMKKYQAKFGKRLYASVRVSQKEIKNAYNNVDVAFIDAIKQMIKNITAVHQAQLLNKKDTIVTSEKGIHVWREWRPIQRVGLYIPGGKAIYPSSVLMTAIPAQIAGCDQIIMCSPPGKNGKIPSPTLVAADM